MGFTINHSFVKKLELAMTFIEKTFISKIRVSLIQVNILGHTLQNLGILNNNQKTKKKKKS